MPYKNLYDCILDLEEHGHLIRIREEVDPDLEMAAIHLRVFEANGPALLFENIKGCKFQAVSNLFGSIERSKFIFRDTLDDIKKLTHFKDNPFQLLKHPFLALKARFALPQKSSSPSGRPGGAFIETTIDQLPQIKCWKNDGGAFVTLPLVYTEDIDQPGIMHSNLGMYRIQLSGNKYVPNKEVGLHYQLHRGIGVHQSKANAKGQPLKVSVFVGGPPAHTVAAVMPLPEGMSELMFAGMLGGKRFRYFYEDGFLLSTDADFIITGEVDPGENKPEGPFGDHLGYYSLTHDFPVMRVHKVYHKKDAIWPFTVVGRPPQEDTAFGNLIHEITGDIIPKTIPGLHEVHAVDAAGVHPLLLAVGSERYTPYIKERRPAEILTIANHILGFGQMSLAKYLFIAAKEDDQKLSAKNIEQFFIHMLERVDWTRDLHFQTKTTIDTLDYSGTDINSGSKAVIAAAGEKKRELGRSIENINLPDGFSDLKMVVPGILAVKSKRFSTYENAGREIEIFSFELGTENLEHFPLLILCDDSGFLSGNLNNFLWTTFTRSNPSHDIYGIDSFTEHKHWGCRGSLIIDARIKPHHAPPLIKDPEIEKRVDQLGEKGNSLHGIILSRNKIRMQLNRYLFIFLISFLLTESLSAQVFRQTIRGRVVDVDSKSSIPGVNVLLLNSDTLIGAVTDNEGKFRLEKVSVGRRGIKFSLIGYEDVVMNNLIVTSGKEVVLQVEMREKVYSTGAVEIVAEKDKTKANNDLVTNSARNFQKEETERYAGSRGDPSKMVANYAGVATGNDARNDIIVRGNSPLGVLWRLEGVDIPNPNHFSTQGATGGAVSILNNNLLGNSDFLTGAFPAEYGNKLAAVFDLKLRNGNNEKHEFIGQMGFNGLELGAEGPLNKKNGASYLVNYRYSTLEIFQAIGISFGVSAVPRYQDISYKVNIPTEKAGIFSVWGIGGYSIIELLDSKKKASDWSFTSKGEDLVFTSAMGATGLSHLYFFNDKISGKLSLSVSASEFYITIDTLSSALKGFRIYNNKSIDGQYTGSYTLTDKINSHHLIKAGVSYNAMFFDYNSFYYSNDYKKYNTQLDARNNSGLARAFAHWQYRITDNLTLNNGLYYQLFSLNNSFSIEPRSGLKWQFKPMQSLSLAYGEHSQMQPLIYYFFNTYNPVDNTYNVTNRSLDFTRGRHFVAGYDFNFAKDFRLKLEGYYQYIYNAPVEKHPSSFSMINLGNNLDGIPLVDSLQNKGTGQNYGIELTVEKFFSKHYYCLGTLSLFESKYKGNDNIERYTAFSGNYVYNLLGGIEVPVGAGNKIFSFDLKMTLAGGNRYTPVNVAASNLQKVSVFYNDQAFSKQYKDYSKVDAKISFRWNQKRASQIWFVSIENIFNTKNILREVYNPDLGNTVFEYQLGLFPYGGYRIEF